MLKKRKRRPLGCFVVDIEKLRKVCRRQQKSLDIILLKFNHHTAGNIRNGEPVRPGTVKVLANAVGEQFTDEYARRIDAKPQLTEPDEKEVDGKPVDEWIEPKVLTKWIETVNGLQYRIQKMRHQFVTTSFARAKCYDLSNLSDDERTRMRDLLVRHPTICRRLPVSPRIPINERTFPDSTGNYWWVIDRWIDGPFLSEVLDKEALSLVEALRIGREMAEGLKLLHDHAIIRRELGPQFVLLRDPDRSVVLTDFELAKLLDASPTVSKDWPQDAYRAPEVGDSKIDARADIYSWGRIVTQMALGTLPPIGQERKTLRGSNLPDELIDLLTRCVALPRSDRPNAMTDVITVLDSLA